MAEDSVSVFSEHADRINNRHSPMKGNETFEKKVRRIVQVLE
tara:strand:+ start:994 stop:1119 length:126 start_codon:yes stop_codon:yes gene_type:complete